MSINERYEKQQLCDMATEQLINAKNEAEKQDAIDVLKELDLPEGFYNLGVHAWKKNGNRAKAFEYFELAGNRGHHESLYVAGKLLLLGFDDSGRGVVQDTAKGLRYLRRAAKKTPAAAKFLKRYGHTLV